MKVRVNFRSGVFLEGDTIKDIQEQWYNLPLFSADALKKHNAYFIETLSIEDADTYEDLTNEIELL